MVVSRRFALRAVAGTLVAGSCSLGANAADEFWNTEPSENWTQDEIQELTTKSPWAKPVTAEIKGYAPLSSAGGMGGGRRGSMGRTTTGRNGAGANPSSGSPKFAGVVRWASAKPIRLALKLQFPPSLADHFVISVSGLPIVSGHGSEDSASGDSVDSYDGLKSQTSLQVKGQEAIQPGVIEPDKNETSTLYFGFLPQLVQLDGDKTVTFATTMPPLNVKVKFELKQMKFKGDLAV
jgi:hypothetical protein